MFQRWIFCVALSFASLAAPALQAQPVGVPPTVSIQVRSLDAVLDNVKLLVTLSGQPQIAKDVERLIKTKIGPQGLVGIDPARPFGAYFRFGKQINDFSGVLLAPIADEIAFLGLLERSGVTAKKDANTDIYTVAGKNGLNLQFYFRFANKYVYATSLNVDALDTKNLLTPADVFPAGQKSALSLAVQIEQLPKDLKFLAEASFKQTVQNAQDTKIPGETPTQKTLRIEAMKGVVEQFQAVLADGKQFAIDLDISKATKEMSATLSLTAKSGTPLAATIADIGKTRSLFGGLRSKDAALQGSITMALPRNLQTLVTAAFDEAQTSILKEMSDEGRKKQAEALLKALGPTLRAGEVDAAFSMTGPKGKAYSFIAAVKLHKGEELNKTIQQFLEQVVKQIPAAARDQIRLNADIAGGTKIHQFKINFGPKEKEMLGDSPLYLAIRDDAVFIATGPDGLANLKAALTDTNAVAAPPLNFELSVSRLAPLSDGPNRDKIMALFQPGEGGGIRVSVEGGPSLQVHITTHLSVVQILGVFADK